MEVIEEPQPTLLVRGEEEGRVEPGPLPARLHSGVDVEEVAGRVEVSVVKRGPGALSAQTQGTIASLPVKLRRGVVLVEEPERLVRVLEVEPGEVLAVEQLVAVVPAVVGQVAGVCDGDAAPGGDALELRLVPAVLGGRRQGALVQRHVVHSHSATVGVC